MPTENKVAPNIQAALDYSRNFATAKPNIGLTEKEHIEGLANLLERTALENSGLQQRLTAADERVDELEADKRRLDLWQNNPGYFGGFAPSGDWSFFNPAGKTCYGKTLREALDQLGVMDADLKSRR